MPLGDIAGELLGGILRLIAHTAGEIVLEFLIRGPGYLICRAFGHRVDPDGAASTLVGILFWAVVALVGSLAWFYLFGGNAVA